MAADLRTAFNTRDIDAFSSLLAEDARWGDEPESPTTCRGRVEIVAHLTRLLGQGVHASIAETTTGPRGIACLLEVDWRGPEQAQPDRHRLYQVYFVTDGLITEIQGYDDRESALTAISD